MPFRRMVMREDKPFLGMKGEDGKQMYHPYEPGYRIRHDISPDEWHEYQLPESSLIKPVDDYANGGKVEHMQAGGLKTLMGEVLNKGGTYAARRLQRAADEIPNLEKLFQEEALRRAFAGGDNASAVMTMNPADFEKYSIPIHPYFTTKKFPTLVKDDYSTDDWVKHLKTVQGYDQVPHLAVDKGEVGADMLPIIIGHEGRHRNRALADKGVTSSLIRFKPRGDLREALPLESQEQYIDSIRKEMQLTGNRVKPEQYYDPVADQEVRRRAIAMPDLYAEGGAVHSQAEDGDIMRQLFDHALDKGDIHEMTHAMLVKQHEAEYG
jgi:hypothetical protein